MTAFALLFLVVLSGRDPLYAQSSATLQGQVFDSSGAVLRGATITVRNDSPGFDRSVVTDDDGRYEVAAIPPVLTRLRRKRQASNPCFSPR